MTAGSARQFAGRRHGAAAVTALRLLAGIVAAAMLAACAVGPDYRRPTAPVPAGWSEPGDWKVAEPADDAARDGWWLVFGDVQLAALVARVDDGFSLAAAQARVGQARAAAEQARAALFPTVGTTVSPTRSRSSAALGATTTVPGRTITRYALSADLSWEADVWGRISRGVESARASEDAARADYVAARLSTQVQLVQNYLLLRVADAQRALFDASVAGFERSLQLTENRYRAGVAARADVVQAQAQLESARAQRADLGVQRAQLEHSLSVLTGRSPGAVRVVALDQVPAVPIIPLAQPSQLLERRPDIAAAERRVAAANAQIGVAQAAFFPALTLGVSAGVQSTDLSRWLTLPGRFWSLGPALAQTLFDGGLRRARSAQAIAAYDETVADYRQTVLEAFQQVEDNLAALRVLEEESVFQQRAVDAATRSVELVQNQYRAGLVSYLNVVTAQATALGEQRAALQLAGRRLSAAVALVGALGGGWQEAAAGR